MRMQLKCLPLLLTALPVLEATQHVFSLNDIQSISPQRHLPWSILLSQNPRTAGCTILSEPAQTQFHHGIQSLGDTLLINKSVIQIDPNEHVVEVLGYNQRNLWAKVHEVCTAKIEYQITQVESSSEYEVVCPLSDFV